MNEIRQRELNKQLFDAIIQGNVGQIEELIVAKADVNACCEALHFAVHKGYTEIITL